CGGERFYRERHQCRPHAGRNDRADARRSSRKTAGRRWYRRISEVLMLRRYFVNTLLSSGMVATAVSVFYPILKFVIPPDSAESAVMSVRSEEHTSELQSRGHLVCRLLLEKKKKKKKLHNNKKITIKSKYYKTT